MRETTFYDEVLWALSVYTDDKFIWFVAGGMTGIFKADVDTGRLEYVSDIQGFGKTDSVKFSCAIKVNKKMFFCPFNADGICEYDIENHLTKIFRAKELYYLRTNNVIYTKDSIYLFGKNQPFIIKFCLLDENISFTQNKKFCSEYKKGIYPLRDMVYKGNSVYITAENGIIELNLQTNGVKEYQIGQIGDQADTLACDGDNFIMLFRERGLIVWERETGQTSFYDVPNLGHAATSIVNDGFLYILYYDVNKVLMFDIAEKISYVVNVEYSFTHKKKENFTPFIYKDRKGIYIYTSAGHKIIHIDSNRNVGYVTLYLENFQSFLEEYMYSVLYEKNQIFLERSDYWRRIETFAGCISKYDQNIRKNKQYVGRNIYKIINWET